MALQLDSSRFNGGTYTRQPTSSYPNLNRWILDQTYHAVNNDFMDVDEAYRLVQVITIDDDDDDDNNNSSSSTKLNSSSAAVPAPAEMLLPGFSRRERNKRKANVLKQDEDVEDVIFVREVARSTLQQPPRRPKKEPISLREDTVYQIQRKCNKFKFGNHQDEDVIIDDAVSEDTLQKNLHDLLGERRPGKRQRQQAPEPAPPVAQQKVEIIATPEPVAEPEPPKPAEYFFTKLPLEVREKIYRQLLVSPKPIPVKGLWTEPIHTRTRRGRGRRGQPDDPDLAWVMDTRILLTCHQAHIEATKVLYSENTFLYILRDPKPNPLIHVPSDDDDSEIDIQPARRGGTARGGTFSARSSKREAQRSRIHLDKYGYLIRHLSMELESNRTDEPYHRLMASALHTLVKPYIHLHTLTITISPLPEPSPRGIPSMNSHQGQLSLRDGRSLSVLPFFSPRKPIPVALERLNLNFLRISVHVNSHLQEAQSPNPHHHHHPSSSSSPSPPSSSSSSSSSGSEDPDSDSPPKPRRRHHLEATIDLRFLPRHMKALRLTGPVGLLWNNDRLMDEQRARRARVAEEALRHLQRHIEEACTVPERVIKEATFWEEHEAAERKRKEKKEREEKKYCGDAYDEGWEEGWIHGHDDEDEDDEEEEANKKEWKTLVVTFDLKRGRVYRI